jgi:hypothetical protein
MLNSKLIGIYGNQLKAGHYDKMSGYAVANPTYTLSGNAEPQLGKVLQVFCVLGVKQLQLF